MKLIHYDLAQRILNRFPHDGDIADVTEGIRRPGTASKNLL